MVPFGFIVLLGGCGSLSPANLFHRQEGGVIARPHAPPPGMNQPYPNLATVPPTPPMPDMAALEHISNGLIADRANARHLEAAAPLADPSSPSASPDLFGVGSTTPPAPPGPAGASASLPAATAPPAVPVPANPPVAAAAPPSVASARPPASAPNVQKAPVGEVQSAALPPTAPATPLPTMSAAPPAPPPNAGLGAPAATAAKPPAAVKPPAAAQPPASAVIAAARPPVAPPPPSAPAVPAAVPKPGNPANTVEVDFAPASSSVPPASLPALRALAAKRGNRVIEALGRGDAASADPAAQEQAVTLGFARAQAIAGALAASGVPRGAIQVMSLASGRGGMAQLID